MSKLFDSRRNLLRQLSAGAIVSALGGCAASQTLQSSAITRAFSRNPWVAPRISMDNVIRVVVGHRPYRPAGPVISSERFDDKLLVHNYGHGGGGLSLSWGSSALALRETAGTRPGDVAVIGSGIMGLTSARLLQDAGWNVTIYTRDVARHTTSNVAAGEWSPFSVYDAAIASDETKSRIATAARIAHHAFTNLTGPDYGVRWLETYTLSDDPFASSDDEDLADLFPYARNLLPDEHPFPAPHVRRFVTMQIDPGVLLRRLTQDFQLAGGRFVIRNFANQTDVLALPQSVIFNCTGLGAAELFGDDEMRPAKGQLVFLPPDPGIDYMTFGGGDGLLYMFPRSDVLLLGGTFRDGDYSRNPEPAETERIVLAHQRMFAEFG